MEGEVVVHFSPMNESSSKEKGPGRPLATVIATLMGEESVEESGRKPPGANGSLERPPRDRVRGAHCGCT